MPVWGSAVRGSMGRLPQARKSGNRLGMGCLWNIVRGTLVFFVVVIVTLVALDGTLLTNLFKKNE